MKLTLCHFLTINLFAIQSKIDICNDYLNLGFDTKPLIKTDRLESVKY